MGNPEIQYQYDENGSVIEKITAEKDEAVPDANYIEKVTYEYNLQNRLSRTVTSYEESGGDINDVTEYTYNDAGIRVKSYYYMTVNGGAKQNEETKIFLICCSRRLQKPFRNLPAIPNMDWAGKQDLPPFYIPGTRN